MNGIESVDVFQTLKIQKRDYSCNTFFLRRASRENSAILADVHRHYENAASSTHCYTGKQL